LIEAAIEHTGQTLLGWRALPTHPDGAGIGNAARAAMPHFEQLFIGSNGVSGEEFERKLYLVRKWTSNALRGDSTLAENKLLYICSLSHRVIVYKGMLTPDQVFGFYPDLLADDFESWVAMIHSRFSTNTFPSWDRAQPNRFMSHNGEINTVLGNRNWMNAREGVVKARSTVMI